MVKTITNPAEETTAAARSATERANHTKDPRDIDEAISKWEEVALSATDEGISEDQADILASFAGSLLLRWDLNHDLKDMQAIVSNLEKALTKLPHSAIKTRYELLIRLAHVHENWYQNFKDKSEALLNAIQSWEEAYSLSVILRKIKDAANEVLPDLAQAYYIAFQDEISGLDSLHQSINYYQLALVQAQPELQSRLGLGLGNVYLELMYYTDEVKNAQLAIDSFESVLKKSKEKEELVKASNGKSQGWWWKLIAEGEHDIHQQGEDFPFRKWTKSVATTYLDNAIAVSYHALSFKWIQLVTNEELAWYQLAWTLLRLKRQPPPPAFHYFWSETLHSQGLLEPAMRDREVRLEDLPMLLLCIEHFGRLAQDIGLKDLHTIQQIQPMSRRISRIIHPNCLTAIQWKLWKDDIIDFLVSRYQRYVFSVTKVCGDLKAVTETEEIVRAQLEAGIIRPKNFPLE